MEAEHVINLVATACSSENDRRFNKWYDEKRISVNMKFKGLEVVDRYKLAISSSLAVDLPTTLEIKAAEYPAYLPFHYFRDVPTADVYDSSPECAVAYKEALDAGIETRYWWCGGPVRTVENLGTIIMSIY